MTGSKDSIIHASGDSSTSPEVTQPMSQSAIPTVGADYFSSNPSLQITIHKLNGSNYMEWAQSVKLSIDCRGKLGHLIREIKQQTSGDPNLKRWPLKNSLIIAWLINSMAPTIGKPHLFLPTAKDVWDAVRDMYSNVENLSQIFELETKLWKSRQGDRDVTTYYNEMVTLWQELDLCYENEWDCLTDNV